MLNPCIYVDTTYVQQRKTACRLKRLTASKRLPSYPQQKLNLFISIPRTFVLLSFFYFQNNHHSLSISTRSISTRKKSCYHQRPSAAYTQIKTYVQQNKTAHHLTYTALTALSAVKQAEPIHKHTTCLLLLLFVLFFLEIRTFPSQLIRGLIFPSVTLWTTSRHHGYPPVSPPERAFIFICCCC